jgi:hypothetical protein
MASWLMTGVMLLLSGWLQWLTRCGPQRQVSGCALATQEVFAEICDMHVGLAVWQ